ncbi:hypothetical protein [Stenotrophomonas sp. NA06056]|uniref:hypothetical protein n=1 Tax=Stenotrophomonas sp. NA06056 TaxID=2742129 RepID=UPI00158C5C34|nr:hypothetical protein [Stenotrophomonas sp. NA06056]QKW56405.1 hypothetical protein HUT07_07150 [Stenotrophomonas sp. NA06056]
MEFEHWITWSPGCFEATALKQGWRFDVSQGLWRIDINRVEAHLQQDLAAQQFGNSVARFIFGFEMHRLGGVLDDETVLQSMAATRDLTRYYRSKRALLAVGQLEWTQVRHLDAAAQWGAYSSTLLHAVGNWSGQSRRPKDFDVSSFRTAIQQSLQALTEDQYAVDPESMDLSPPEWDEAGRFIHRNLDPGSLDG